MLCGEAREAIGHQHGLNKREMVDERFLTNALEHLRDCMFCRCWVYETLCPFVKKGFEGGGLAGDALIFHGMLHEGAMPVADCIVRISMKSGGK